jgi:hypothetical protein
MKYTLPVSFQVNLEVEVEGKSINDAFANFQRDAMLQREEARRVIFDAIIQKDGTLLDLMKNLMKNIPADTIELDEEAAAELNPKNVYSVEVTRTISISVEVEAHSVEEAEDIASESLDNGDYANDFEDSMCAVTDDEIGSINLERVLERKQVS